MTTLLNLFYSIPALIGALAWSVSLIFWFAPWDKIKARMMWALIVAVVFCWYWSDRGLKAFKAWMTKPEKWYDGSSDLFI